MSFRARLKASAFALPLLFSSPFALANSVDIVFVIDESGSMEDEHRFVQDLFVPSLDQALEDANYAKEDRRYGFIGFGSQVTDSNGDETFGIVRNIFEDALPGNPNGLYGTSEDYATAAQDLRNFGAFEHGFAAINRAIDEYFGSPRGTDGPQRLIIMVTDEDSDIPLTAAGAAAISTPTMPFEEGMADPLAEFNGLKAQSRNATRTRLNDQGITLISVVDQRLRSPVSTEIYVANNDQYYVIVDDPVLGPSSSINTVNLVIDPTSDGTTEDYTNTALGTANGCVADLQRIDDNVGNSGILDRFSEALVDCSIEALAARELASPSAPLPPGTFIINGQPVVVPATVPPGSLRTRSFIIYGSRDQIRLLVRRSHDLLRGHRTVVSAFAPDPETLSVSTANASGELASQSRNSPIQFSFSADTGSAENIAESGIQAIFAALQEGANDEPLRVKIGSISAFALFEASDATYDLDQRFDSYDSTGGIALMGMNYEVQPGVTVGAAAAYQVFELEAHERRDEVDVDGYSLSLFGDTVIAPNTVLDGILSYTRSQFDTTRETDNDGLAFSNTNGYAVSASATLSHEVSQGQYLITPSLSLAATHTSFDNFNEYGDDPNIYYGDDETIFSIEPKIQVSRNIVEEEWVITPTAGLGAVIVQDGDEGTVRSISRNGFIANPELAPTENLSGLISLNLEGSRMDYGASFNIGYSGEFGSDITRHSIIAGAKLRF